MVNPIYLLRSDDTLQTTRFSSAVFDPRKYHQYNAAMLSHPSHSTVSLPPQVPWKPVRTWNGYNLPVAIPNPLVPSALVLNPNLLHLLQSMCSFLSASLAF